MPARRRSTPSAQDQPIGLTSRRRFLRAAGVGTAGAVVAAGAVAGQAGADPDGPARLAVAIPPRRRPFRQAAGADGAATVQAASGPLSFHTITPRRYLDTRSDSGGPFGPGDAFVFDFGAPDYFAGGVTNEVPANAQAIACNLTVTSGTAGGNLRAFPANLQALPQVANLNWGRGQTVGNYAAVGAATGPDGQGGQFQAAVVIAVGTPGTVHVIVDIFGYFA
jgi:hypothetical protein